MNMIEEQNWFLQDVRALWDYCWKNGFQLSGGELWRTEQQQKIYFETGKSKTMNSNHLRRLAIDLNFFKNGKLISDFETLKPIGEFWESLNPKNRWGGNFKSLRDTPHFERNV